MLSLRAHVIICASLFAALLLIVPLAGLLHVTGLIKNPAAYKIPAIAIVGGLFAAFAFSKSNLASNDRIATSTFTLSLNLVNLESCFVVT